MKKALFLLAAVLLVACSSSNGPENNPEFNSAYFPASDGDTWYYTKWESEKIVREIDGDTAVNGVNCIRVLENGSTSEAWRIVEDGDSAGFYVHMLTYGFESDTIRPYFDPPLRIPLNMNVGEEYDYASDAFYEQGGTAYTFSITGTLVFEGFVDKTVPAGSFGDVARIHYYDIDENSDTTQYYEYYAPGVGLLDNEIYVLDSAFIDRVWIR
ncbi:MAG TPA: hypothetical protein ENO22_13925 [candidate division Zixibacteria bacterium]|nr:hypothetical protein [candidate division Zixibacteria bacterium]